MLQQQNTDEKMINSVVLESEVEMCINARLQKGLHCIKRQKLAGGKVKLFFRPSGKPIVNPGVTWQENP